VSGDERGEGTGAIAEDEEIMTGIGRVSAAKGLAEWIEMEGTESRGIVDGATGSGLDVGEDEEVREAGVGKHSGIVPAM
jgi:hypothetical protein